MHTISIRYTLTQIIYKFIIKKRTYEHSLFTLRVRDIDSQRERERERDLWYILLIGFGMG